MDKKTNIWLLLAAGCLVVGCIIFAGVMSVLKWDFNKLSTVKYETNTYNLSEEIMSISLTTCTANVVLIPGEGENATVTCYEQKNEKHTVSVKDGTLTVQYTDTRKWYEHIGISFGATKIVISIPGGEYGSLSIKSDTGNVEIPKDFTFESIDIREDTGKVTNRASASGAVKIKTTTGDILVENISAGSMDLSVSTGKITASEVTCTGDVKVGVSTGKTNLSGVKCKNLISNGTTGSLSLKNVIATESFSLTRSTGDVVLDGCDAAQINAKTTTGSITGTLLSEKVFITSTSTGKIDVPKTLAGGKCELSTSTGNIKIKIQ